jgi:P-type Cu+ transporter
LTPILLTGDNTAAANGIADQAGIATVIAEVMPADKVSVVKRLQGEGKVVAMVGDGVNDDAALTQADLGIAMGTGTDVAIEASDLTLVRGDLRSAADAIRLSRRILSMIKGNLLWVFRLQHADHSPGGGRIHHPGPCGGGDGVLQRLRGLQQPAVVPVPRGGLA